MTEGFRSRNVLIAVGIVAVAAAVTAAAILLRPQPPRTPPAERVPVVTTVPADPWSRPLIVSGSGTVRPRAEIDLAPQVGGRIEYVSPDFVSGGRVTRGELLVRIEADDYENAVAQARAQVAQDRVAVLQAEEEARIAADEFRRFQARRGVTADPSPLTLREPQLNAARAALDRSQAQLADAELALSRTEITAQFDGVVRSESADVGGLASPGAPLGRLFTSDVVEVVVPLTDADAALLQGVWGLRAGTPDQSLPARVYATFGDRRFRWDGYVDRAEAALDEQTRTVDVIVRVPAPFESGRPVPMPGPDSAATSATESVDADDTPPLLVGQFADVEMDGRTGDYFRIPRRALAAGNEIWVTEGDTVRVVPVRVVQRSDDDVFVTGALAAGDLVITSGITLATNGMRVRLASEADEGGAQDSASGDGEGGA